MRSMKDLIYDKHGQSWYKPVIVRKLWTKCVFVPSFVYKYCKALYKTKCDTVTDPEMRWLYLWLIDHGLEDQFISLYNLEQSIKKNVSKIKESLQ